MYLCNMQGTSKEEKNDLLFEKFEINYQKLDEMFRQGSCILKTEVIFYFCNEIWLVSVVKGFIFHLRVSSF